jgi:hypothetical protein
MDEDFILPRPGPPPLRIHHLMACAAFTAVMFTLWRTFYAQAGAISAANGATMVIGGGITAIGFTIALFTAFWHTRGYAALVQPGQWLLIEFGVSGLYSLVVLSIFIALGARSFSPSGDWWYAYRAFFAIGTYLVPLVFNLWCAWKVADTRAWRFAFVVFALAAIVISPLLFELIGVLPSMLGAQNIYMASHLGQCVVTLTALMAAALNDWFRKVRRYWTHWLGVGLMFLSIFSYILSLIVYSMTT